MPDGAVPAPAPLFLGQVEYARYGEGRPLLFHRGQYERIVDAVCMQLVMHPEKFDVLLLPNLYGDIVSDLCAGLVGGLGIVPSANLGTEIGLFEAVHGSAPDIAGRSVANPTALLLSALLMLRHIGEDAIADRIMGGLSAVLRDGTGPNRRGWPRSEAHARIMTTPRDGGQHLAWRTPDSDLAE
mgnify:CR=1 FL=1